MGKIQEVGRESFWKTRVGRSGRKNSARTILGWVRRNVKAYMIEILHGLGAYLFVTHEPLCPKFTVCLSSFFFVGSAVLFEGSHDGLL